MAGWPIAGEELGVKSCKSPKKFDSDRLSMDLFKLLVAVRDKGGYDVVTKDGLWDLVAIQSRLVLSHPRSVKLVYVNFLDVLEKWLKKEKNSISQSTNTNYDLLGNPMELVPELETFKAEMEKWDVESRYHEEPTHNDSVHRADKPVATGSSLEENDIEHVDVSSHKRKSVVDVKKKLFSDPRRDYANSSVVDGKGSNRIGEYDEKETSIDSSPDYVVLDSKVKGKSSQKRKRESNWEMLAWITKVAADPCQPAVEPLPERSKWSSYGNDKLWKQVLSFRKAVCLIGEVPTSEKFRQIKKMHPCMYEDHNAFNYNLKERRNGASSQHPERTVAKLEASGSDSSNEEKKIVPVGSKFQAKVPEWTGVILESDSKWFGTRIWPLARAQNRYLVERDPIGKGRQDSCGCKDPGSPTCDGFHIRQKSEKLKLELGPAFVQWDFHKMGEEAATYWSDLEQKKFNVAMRTSPPSLDDCFWDQIAKILPTKSRAELVNYYYNVILLRHRANQNRATPNNINSDDDEPESESETSIPEPRVNKSTSSILFTPKKPSRRAK